mmetsp:Transcript_10385/g.45074  ORF Transcript_10385/g.45074 Transcript_10385/m.45074 type:complete len:352 (-) Transcript_10385:229-1284(-)
MAPSSPPTARLPMSAFSASPGSSRGSSGSHSAKDAYWSSCFGYPLSLSGNASTGLNPMRLSASALASACRSFGSIPSTTSNSSSGFSPTLGAKPYEMRSSLLGLGPYDAYTCSPGLYLLSGERQTTPPVSSMYASHPGLWLSMSAHGTSASAPPRLGRRMSREKSTSNAHRSAPGVSWGWEARISSIAASTEACRSIAARCEGEPARSSLTSSSGQSRTPPVRLGSALTYVANRPPSAPASMASACSARNAASTDHSWRLACAGPRLDSAMARSTVIRVLSGMSRRDSPRRTSSVATSPRPSGRSTTSSSFCAGSACCVVIQRMNSSLVAVPTHAGISSSLARVSGSASES